MANGIAIAQSGTPIETAADYKETVDSRWNTLAVAFYGTINITVPYIAPGATVQAEQNKQRFIVMTHGLGFFPLFEVYGSMVNATTGSSNAAPGITNITASSQTDGTSGYPMTIYADATNIYFFPQYQYNYGQNAITYKINYRIYRLDIQKPFMAPTGTFLGSGRGDSNIGVKFLDGTHSASLDKDSPIGFSMDTTRKTIAVHSVINQSSLSSMTFTIVHNVGYPPSYLVCLLPTQRFSSYWVGYIIPWRNDYLSTPIYNLQAYTTADDNTITFRGIQSAISGDFCFVILKDSLSIKE